MGSKEKITRLMKAGFTLDEALEVITGAEPETGTNTGTGTDPGTSTGTDPGTSTGTPAEPEESAEVKAIRGLSAQITELINATRETARLYGVDSKTAGETAEDILSKLG